MLCTIAFSALASSTLADQVLLQSTDGTVNFEGDLISFTDDYYLLQTVLGDIRIAADRVQCRGAGCPNFVAVEADTVIAGSDTLAEGLMPLILEGFATNTQSVSQVASASEDDVFATTLIGQDGFGERIGTIEVRSGSSGDAFSALLDKSAQIGLSSRRISPDEARALSADGAGNMVDPSQEHIVAIDSLNVIVNPANGIDAISIRDLASIFSGGITNWSQLGGSNVAILPVTLTDDAATAVFETGVFGDTGVPKLFSSFEASDNVAAANYVGDNPGAIAYVGFAFKRGQKPLSLISECGIGTTPDAFSVKTEEYALFRRLYMYNRADLSDELAETVIEYATSDASSIVIQQSGFIDLSVERISQGSNGPRANRIKGSGAGRYENGIVDNMIAMLDENDRLSSTFRFRTGSTELDARALRDIERLATYLEGMPNGTKVTFAGFADSVGSFEPNLALSKARAGQVMKALTDQAGGQLGNVTFETRGFGEVAPSACNTSDAGRSINRRVETWVDLP